MMTSLKLAGILDRIAGFVFGTCSECEPDSGFASLTPEEIFADHVAPLGIPAWTGRHDRPWSRTVAPTPSGCTCQRSTPDAGTLTRCSEPGVR
jgi:hypothetical protein